VASMGCSKITYQNFNFLEVVHRKKATAKFIFGLNGDHLGNIRLSYSDADGNGSINASTEILEENNYYPSGLKHKGYNNVISGIDHPYGFNGKEENNELGLGTLDFGARNYDPALMRWMNLDPLADKNHFDSPYAFVHNNPMIYVDPDGKDAILIVFPDYKISTPVGKVGGLGHAGVLLIDNKTGVTKYYEYGRYDKENKGLTRKVTISNVEIGKDGKPTTESLNKVLGQISDKSGQSGRIDGAYIVSDEFDAMNDYAKGKLEENKDPDRKEYSLSSNNCGTFAADCVNQDESVDAPWLVNPTPTNIVEEYQEEGNAKVTYDPKNKTTTIGKGNEEDAKKKKD